MRPIESTGSGAPESDSCSGRLSHYRRWHVLAIYGILAPMFVKLTRSGSRRYLQWVESCRDEAPNPRQHTIATVGRLDEANDAVQYLLSGLLRATGQPAPTTDTNVPAAPNTPGTPGLPGTPGMPGTPNTRFDSSMAYGDVLALDRLLHELCVDETSTLLRSATLSFDAEPLMRALVFKRLGDAASKLGFDAAEVTHQRLLRTMDALQTNSDAVAVPVSLLLRPLIDQRLSVAFYDLTTIRAEGLSEQPGELCRFGLAKDGVIAQQWLLTVVLTTEGLPIAHRVWGGNGAETATRSSAIAEVTRNYPVQRIILVAVRGLLSVDNLAMLDALKVADGPLGYIVSVPGRRYAEFVQVLADGRQVAAGDQLRRPQTHRGSAALQEPGRYRERLPCAPERDRDHADVPSAARPHSRPCADLLHRSGPAPRHAYAAEVRRQQGLTRAGAGVAAPAAEAPRASHGRPDRRRLVDDQLRASRALHQF